MINQDKFLANCEQLIAPGERFKIRIDGYSMLPLLGRGKDSVVVRRTSPSDSYQKGDIALFRTEARRLVAHRIRKINNTTITLQGDGNPIATEQCHTNDIIGVIEAVIRENGKLVSCTSLWWRMRGKIWLMLPRVVRSYTLALMRRWLNYKQKQ